jgi:uncharacterized protein
MDEREKIRRYLDEAFTEPLRDPLWKHIYLSEGMNRITQAPEFRRLTRIRQLGPAYLVYPGAVHSRFGHSLGVFRLAFLMLRSFLRRDWNGRISLEGALSFLVAALSHDLGHFPYTHSLKELPLKDHECLTAEIVLEKPLADMIRAAGADPDMVAAIVDKERAAEGESLFFRKLLSGVLDPDKLDYLNRDAFYCGVPYGTQDVDFIFSRIYPDEERGMAIDAKGILSIEHVLFSKYLMYRSVYWHRDIRSATSMMKKALFGALEGGALSKEDLYRLDDESFRARAAVLPQEERRLAACVFEGNIFSACAEVAFDPANDFHRSLESLSFRRRMEAEAAAEARSKGADLGPNDVVIDLPEDISFESDLWIRDAGLSFSSSQTVLGPAVVSGFTRSLRVIRVFSRYSLPAGNELLERLRG